MIYFIAGMQNREFKYLEILESIRKKDSLVEHFYDADVKEEYEQFLEKSSTNSVFSFQHDLIVLKRAEKIKKIDELLDKFLAIRLINKDIIIDFEKSDGKLSAKLSEKLKKLEEEKLVEVYLFKSSDNTSLVEFIKKELAVNDKIANSLIKRIGTNPLVARQEVNKIKLYFNGDPFDMKIAENIISVEKEYKNYEIVEKIFSNEIPHVLEYLEKTNEYSAILYMIYSDLEMMLKLSNMMIEGYNFSNNYNVFKMEFEDIKDIFTVDNRIPNSYAVFKKMGRLKKFTNKSLKKLVYDAWKIENEIKSGKLEMSNGVETLIIEVNSLQK